MSGVWGRDKPRQAFPPAKSAERLILKQNVVDTGIIQSEQRDKFRRNRATNHTVTTRIQTSILHKM